MQLNFNNKGVLKSLSTLFKLKDYYIILLPVFLFSSFNLRSQNYIEYHRLINRLNLEILNEEYNDANTILDSITSNFSYIDATTTFKALQISTILKDTIRQKYWLKKAISLGIPMWILKQNKYTMKSLMFFHQDSCTSQKEENSIPSEKIKKIIDSIYVIDQHLTNILNGDLGIFNHVCIYFKWKKMNKNHFNIIYEIMEDYSFPSEKLIGIPEHYKDSNEVMSFFRSNGIQFKDYKATIMLIHYFSSFRFNKTKTKKLLKMNLDKGFINPDQFALIMDMMELKSFRLNKKYFVRSINDPRINERRAKIGMCTVEQENILFNEIIQRRKNGDFDNYVTL